MATPHIHQIELTHEYEVSIVDDDCADDTAWCHRIPIATDRFEILKAIETLYPTVTSFTVSIVEKG